MITIGVMWAVGTLLLTTCMTPRRKRGREVMTKIVYGAAAVLLAVVMVAAAQQPASANGIERPATVVVAPDWKPIVVFGDDEFSDVTQCWVTLGNVAVYGSTVIRCRTSTGPGVFFPG